MGPVVSSRSTQVSHKYTMGNYAAPAKRIGSSRIILVQHDKSVRGRMQHVGANLLHLLVNRTQLYVLGPIVATQSFC